MQNALRELLALELAVELGVTTAELLMEKEDEEEDQWRGSSMASRFVPL